MSNLSDFIKKEITRRELSIRGFADLCGVTHTTLLRYLEGDAPTLDFLGKLARATNTDLIALIDLAFPGLIEETRASPEAIIFAQQLDQLPPEVRDVLYRMILK